MGMQVHKHSKYICMHINIEYPITQIIIHVICICIKEFIEVHTPTVWTQLNKDLYLKIYTTTIYIYMQAHKIEDTYAHT